jgi:hypothetical protein
MESGRRRRGRPRRSRMSSTLGRRPLLPVPDPHRRRSRPLSRQLRWTFWACLSPSPWVEGCRRLLSPRPRRSTPSERTPSQQASTRGPTGGTSLVGSAPLASTASHRALVGRVVGGHRPWTWPKSWRPRRSPTRPALLWEPQVRAMRGVCLRLRFTSCVLHTSQFFSPSWSHHIAHLRRLLIPARPCVLFIPPLCAAFSIKPGPAEFTSFQSAEPSGPPTPDVDRATASLVNLNNLLDDGTSPPVNVYRPVYTDHRSLEELKASTATKVRACYCYLPGPDPRSGS